MRGAVSWRDVDVLGPQACRAVVAVAAVAQRCGRPCRWLCLRVEEVIFNRSAGFRFVLTALYRAVPRLGRGRDRFTAASPSSGVGDYFRFRLHRGLSHPPDPDHGRVWVIVPATALQASPEVGGRCHPALTGVGVVPWCQNRIRAAGRSRAIPPPTSPCASSGSG